AWHLAEESHDAANREPRADFDLRPFLRRQIDRNERTETGLHIRQKKDEPVETAKAASRRHGRRGHRASFSAYHGVITIGWPTPYNVGLTMSGGRWAAKKLFPQ